MYSTDISINIILKLAHYLTTFLANTLHIVYNFYKDKEILEFAKVAFHDFHDFHDFTHVKYLISDFK